MRPESITMGRYAGPGRAFAAVLQTISVRSRFLKANGAAHRRPVASPGRSRSVRNGGLRIRRERRVRDRAAQEIERLLERAIVLLVRRHIGLRVGLFVSFLLGVGEQRRLALRMS